MATIPQNLIDQLNLAEQKLEDAKEADTASQAASLALHNASASADAATAVALAAHQAGNQAALAAIAAIQTYFAVQPSPTGPTLPTGQLPS